MKKLFIIYLLFLTSCFPLKQEIQLKQITAKCIKCDIIIRNGKFGGWITEWIGTNGISYITIGDTIFKIGSEYIIFVK